jgi:hypothetical protein
MLDVNGNRRSENKFAIKINPINNELSISSLQITNNIIPQTLATGTEATLFLKNQHYVFPNPQREISADIPTLHLYSEIYNAKDKSPEGISITYKIINSKNEVEIEYTRNKNSAGNAIVDVISFPLDAVPTGIYTISLMIKSGDEKDSAISSNTFYLINSNIEPPERVYYTEDEQFELSEFATYDMERINLEFEQCKFLATKDENAV